MFSGSQNWFSKAEQEKIKKHIAAHHNTSYHNAEENKNEKMSQGRTEKHCKSTVSSYLILGLFKSIFRKK